MVLTVDRAMKVYLNNLYIVKTLEGDSMRCVLQQLYWPKTRLHN
jgi:hypothetical protein